MKSDQILKDCPYVYSIGIFFGFFSCLFNWKLLDEVYEIHLWVVSNNVSGFALITTLGKLAIMIVMIYRTIGFQCEVFG